MDKEYIMEYSGRRFTREDIELIQWTREQYPDLSRKELASTVCEFLEWTTDAGRPKNAPCLKFLEKLESGGTLTLPPVRPQRRPSRESFLELSEPEAEVTGTLKEQGGIRLVLAETPEARKRFRSQIEAHHALGYRRTFGSRLSYFITRGDGVELGCLQFSASSWALKERDEWIGWTRDDRARRLHLIINNSRFLIFPWVHVPNLASHALSLASKRIRGDYMRVYFYEPVLLETFVDPERFRGTCYKAANWDFLGKTKGRGRTGKAGDTGEKDVYARPLCKDFRKYLRGEKAYGRGDAEHDF